MEKQRLIILTGPTAVGKSALSISLAREVGGEIISADSMQVYKHMDIGSDKITKEKMGGIPHYLVDVLEPTEDFHVVRFQEMAKAAMQEIYSHGKVPILVGGTGFYIQAVTRDIDFTKAEIQGDYRAGLERLAEEEGPEALHERLKALDPDSAAAIHPNNVKRVIRALEFYQENQAPISSHNASQRQKESPYDLSYFVLNAPRPILYERIDQRVDEMMRRGLVEEVKGLVAMGCRKGMTSMQGLGYKEILEYLSGAYSLEEAVRVIKRDTRHFAKRQLTWFRREGDVTWVDKDAFGYEEGKILEYLCECLGKKADVDK